MSYEEAVKAYDNRTITLKEFIEIGAEQDFDFIDNSEE